MTDDYKIILKVNNRNRLSDILLLVSEAREKEILEYNYMLKNRYEEEYTDSEIQYTKDSIEALDTILFIIRKLIEK